jgi:N-acyl-D-amino-acid deacylase
MARAASGREQDILLKGGLVVDGTGAPAYAGHLLIRAGRIARLSPRPLRTTGIVIDCTGRVVAPGFIDPQSHLDWHVGIKGHDELKYPFLAQGITTVIGGAGGSSAAGFRENSIWKAQAENALLRNGLPAGPCDTVAEFKARLASSGASHNIALLVGHGSTRASIRGNDASPLHPYETKELLWLLERAMDEGARGVSLGLQYEPGIYAKAEELREVAALVRRRGKLLSVDLRAFGAYPPGSRERGGNTRSRNEPSGVAALREVLDLARATGVRLQVSHLAFVGTRTWRTAEAALAMIDKARADGVDVRFGACPHHCGASLVSVLLPPWFLARGRAAWDDPASLRKLKREIHQAEKLLGFGPADIQVTNTMDPDLAEYNGRFLHEIARVRRLGPIDALVDISRRSGGQARVLLHRSGTEAILDSLVRHPASLFMTDAWVERQGVQNPAAFGAFPRLLQVSRERHLISREETVHKMSGATAERFGLAGRGVLAEGNAADVVVFDGESVADTTSPADTSGTPIGVDYVFVNGKKIIGSGRKENPLNAGVPLE